MAKKKSFKKKVKKNRSRSTTATIAPVSNAIVDSPKSLVSSASKPISDPKMDYINQDLRRILILIVGFISLQLVVWYFLSHTSLGPSIYNLIKL